MEGYFSWPLFLPVKIPFFGARFQKILPPFSPRFIGISRLLFHLAREQNGKFGLIDSRGINQLSAVSYQPSGKTFSPQCVISTGRTENICLKRFKEVRERMEAVLPRAKRRVHLTWSLEQSGGYISHDLRSPSAANHKFPQSVTKSPPNGIVLVEGKFSF